MVERLVQSVDALKLLPDLKADIRNGVLAGNPQAVIERIEAPEKMRLDERVLNLMLHIEDARRLDPSAEPQLAQAVLGELSERVLERGEEPSEQLALYAVVALFGRIQQKRARGRPRRSNREKLYIYLAYKILIRRKGYTVGQAQREIGGWIHTKPDAVAKIIRDWERSEPEPSSEKNGSIRESYVFVIDCLERQEVVLWTSRVSRCGFRRRAG